jgi:type II secretory pathway component PulJ
MPTPTEQRLARLERATAQLAVSLFSAGPRAGTRRSGNVELEELIAENLGAVDGLETRPAASGETRAAG